MSAVVKTGGAVQARDVVGWNEDTEVAIEDADRRLEAKRFMISLL